MTAELRWSVGAHGDWWLCPVGGSALAGVSAHRRSWAVFGAKLADGTIYGGTVGYGLTGEDDAAFRLAEDELRRAGVLGPDDVVTRG